MTNKTKYCMILNSINLCSVFLLFTSFLLFTCTSMSYESVWVDGLQECSLCEDARFARTGVCISCDAGMCRSFFHVTCAQREGLLSEAAAEEVSIKCFYLMLCLTYLVRSDTCEGFKAVAVSGCHPLCWVLSHPCW